MSKEQNIKVYKAAYAYLLSIKPSSVNLENYFYGDSRNYESLKDIYIQFITSAQNYQHMPSVIKFSQRKEDVSEMLYKYDIQRISEMDSEKLYREFRDRFKVTSKDGKNNSWYKWSCTIVDSAKFVSGFKDASDFDEFVKRFDYNAISRMALPLLIKSKIRGIGFVLACDLLKELGYTNYPKPDVHMIDVFYGICLCEAISNSSNSSNSSEEKLISVFEAIERMADDCRTVDDSVTPYKVDKVFWLICSGYYYKERQPIRIKGHKKELIKLLKKTMQDK